MNDTIPFCKFRLPEVNSIVYVQLELMFDFLRSHPNAKRIDGIYSLKEVTDER